MPAHLTSTSIAKHHIHLSCIKPGALQDPGSGQGDGTEKLGLWPAEPDEHLGYKLDLTGTFKRRVEYCRRLAARQSRHQGGRLGLGVGWKFLILEGFGPIFDPEHLPYDKDISSGLSVRQRVKAPQGCWLLNVLVSSRDDNEASKGLTPSPW